MYYVRVVVTSETVRAKPSDIMAPCSAEDLGIKDKVIRRGIARGFGTLNNTPQPSIDQSEQVRLTISNRETTESIEETGQSVHEQNAQSENKQTNKQSNKQTIKQTNKKAASNAVKQKKKSFRQRKNEETIGIDTNAVFLACRNSFRAQQIIIVPTTKCNDSQPRFSCVLFFRFIRKSYCLSNLCSPFGSENKERSWSLELFLNSSNRRTGFGPTVN